MEHVSEFLYHGAAVLLFCIAAALLFSQFRELEQMEREVKANLYDRHVISCRQLE